MSDIPSLAAELAARMKSLGYSKGIVNSARRCGREMEEARIRYGLSNRSLGKVIDLYTDEWRRLWKSRQVSHTRYTIRIKAAERMLAGDVALHFLSTKGTLVQGHPFAHATDLNPRLAATPSADLSGWIVVDFASAPLAAHIYEANFS